MEFYAFVRAPLKYLCFSHSFLDKLRKYHVETIESSSSKDILEMMAQVGRLEQHSTKFGQSCS
jgi:hypothetical protein